jgi:glycosyltransferase involved in cell wall biosynthesis
MNNCHYIIFHHSFEKLAGTERVIFNLLELFSSYTGARVTLLLAGKEAKLVLPLDHLPVEIVYLNVDIKHGNAFHLIASHSILYRSLARCLKTWTKDERFICLATNPFLAILMKLASLRLKKKIAVVSCEHFSLSVSGKISLIARTLFYKYLYVVTLTQRDRELVTNRYHPLRCVCIPNASPFEIMPYNSFTREKIILAIGRLSKQKGFDLLVRSYALLAAKNTAWKLVIVGDDYGEKSMLEQMIIANGLQHKVTIIPATNDIVPYYQVAGLYVLSSRFEGLPMVLIEAMSFGLPLIAFDCPTGPAELVKQSNGVLVENGNIQKLADAIEALINSPELLSLKAAGSERYAQEFTKMKINKLWDSLLTSIEIK